MRGSVACEGPEAMLATVKELEGFEADGASFEAWRIKNTHHRKAEVVGGYRDVMLIGAFSAEVEGERVRTVVEVQVIDATFLAIKKYMHLPFSIARGDYW